MPGRWVSRFWARLQGRQFEADMADELHLHLEMQEEENRAAGMSPEEAHHAALREFGPLGQIKEVCREQRMGFVSRQCSLFLRDLRFAFRQLRKSPGFTVASILTLALGIGVNTALFTVVRAVLLTPLPFKEPGRLFNLWDQPALESRGIRLLSVPEFLDVRDRQRSFEGVAAFRNGSANLALGDGAERLGVTLVTPNLFPLLGIQPNHGRGFAADEAAAGSDGVVVLSHGLWIERFGGAQDVLGRSIRLNDVACRVIGIMPAGFAFPNSAAALWRPLVLGSRGDARRENHSLFAFVRLNSGVSREQADQDLARVRRDVQADQAGTSLPPDRERFRLESMLEGSVGDVRRPLVILMGAALLVLLVSCVNVAGLLAVRASVRCREISLRLALGAGRIDVFRQFAAEGALLGGIGGACSLAAAQLVLKLIVAIAPDGVPRLEQAQVDRIAILFTMGTSLAAALGISVAPALQGFRVRVLGGLSGSGGRFETRGLLRLREIMATTQVSVSVLLVICAGLLLQSLHRLLQDDLGFDTRQVLAFKVYPSESNYPEPGHLDQFYEQLLARIEALPGVDSAGGVSNIPLNTEWNSVSVSLRGLDESTIGAEPGIGVGARYLRSRYFETMRIRLVCGRLFGASDTRSAQPVAIVDELFVTRFWTNPGEALGQQLSFPGEPGSRTIVGVVRRVKHYGPGVESQPEVYVPQSQSAQRGMYLALRTSVSPETLASAVRARLAELDVSVPIYNLATEEGRYASLVQRPRFVANLLTCFAGVALALAAVGSFGVVSYSTSRRTREFGVRFALGARRSDVARIVLVVVLRMIAAGGAVGAACAVPCAWALRGLLFGVSPLNVETFVAASAVAAAVTVISCAWPIVQAARTHPSEALRTE